MHFFLSERGTRNARVNGSLLYEAIDCLNGLPPVLRVKGTAERAEGSKWTLLMRFRLFFILVKETHCDERIVWL